VGWLVVRALLTRTAYQRAEVDLRSLYARLEGRLGQPAARRACLREGLLIVMWFWFDGLRRVLEFRPSAERRASVLFDLGQELRLSARALARRPGFTGIAIAVLGLGIGATVAIFSLADRLFLRPPAGVHAPQELVRVFRSWAPGMGGSVSYPDYLDYRDGTNTLRALAAYGSSPLAASVRIGDEPGPASVLTVTANYFDLLGLRAEAGRFFMPAENQAPGAHAVAVVSHGFWVSRLGGARSVLGRDIVVNGRRFTVVGVAPRDFRGLSPADARVDVYIPIMMRGAVAPTSDRAWYMRVPSLRERWLSVVGRRNAHVNVAAVQSDLARIADHIRTIDSQSEPNETVLVSQQFRWFPATRGSLAGLTRVLLAAVGLLLAVATANVAILLLARVSARDREIGVRAALGAGRGRIARQMIVESLLLGLSGCLFGLAISVAGVRVVSTLLPVQLETQILPDLRVLGFAAALSLLTALVIGIAPSWRAARHDVVGLIHGRSRRAGGGHARDVLVVVQIALSLVLVAGSVLFARSFAAARALDVGFDDRGVLLIDVNLRNHGYNAERGRVFLRQALDRLAALPGVTLATSTRQVPFQGDWSTTLRAWPGASFAAGKEELEVGLNVIAPRYFEGMGIPLLLGREFSGSDETGSAPVMVVNETFARQVFGSPQVLGRTVPLREGMPPFTIVGVARDAKYYALNESPTAQAYGPVFQLYQPDVTFLLKTSRDPTTLATSAQNELHALDPNLAFSAVETLEAVHNQQMARFRATAQVVGLSGLFALLLACAGLYGVMAYRVAQRTREIGLRIALGATNKTVARTVLSRGLLLTVAGLALGTAAALSLGQLAEGLLFDIQARDPVSLIAAPLVLLVVAAAALLAPTRRAMRVDPLTAIRTE
jgi:predicted permease